MKVFDIGWGSDPDGSVTMLLGSSGSGKTLLGAQFLSEGLKRGERGVYFGFFERPRFTVHLQGDC